MTNVISFPIERQRPVLDCRCLSCSSLVDPAEGFQIEVPSLRVHENVVSVLCRECYEETPAWVWTAE